MTSKFVDIVRKLTILLEWVFVVSAATGLAVALSVMYGVYSTPV